MTRKSEIEKVIDLFFHAMDTQNFDLMKSLLPEDATMVHIGTDKDEIWKGWNTLMEATEEQFQRLEYYKASIHDLNVNFSQSNTTAWYFHLLDAEIKSNGKLTRLEKARFTGVLEKIDGSWKIMQTHVSVPG